MIQHFKKIYKNCLIFSSNNNMTSGVGVMGNIIVWCRMKMIRVLKSIIIRSADYIDPVGIEGKEEGGRKGREGGRKSDNKLLSCLCESVSNNYK